jgi:hypothetical protein
MRRMLLGFGALALMISLLGLVTSPSVHAADGFNIVTSPLPIKLSTPPGRTVTTELRMKNLNPQNETIKMGLMKFGATGESGQPNLFDLTPKDTYANWVTFTPRQFVAEPNVWKTVTMTINVPPEASLGYYLAVTFSRASQPGDSAGQSSVRGSAATLVLLDVQGANDKRSLSLLDFNVQKKLYEYVPVNFNVKLRNTGNIYLAPTGNIFISKGDKPVATINFNDAGSSVLPGSNRVYTVPWSSGFPRFQDKIVDGKPVYDKQAKPVQELKYDFSQASKLRFGKYTAKLVVVYDDGKHDVPTESSVTFWVLPWKIMSVGAILLLILGFGVFVIIRNILRKARGIRKPTRSEK